LEIGDELLFGVVFKKMDEKRFDMAGIESEIKCSSICEEEERGITKIFTKSSLV